MSLGAPRLGGGGRECEESVPLTMGRQKSPSPFGDLLSDSSADDEAVDDLQLRELGQCGELAATERTEAAPCRRRLARLLWQKAILAVRAQGSQARQSALKLRLRRAEARSKQEEIKAQDARRALWLCQAGAAALEGCPAAEDYKAQEARSALRLCQVGAADEEGCRAAEAQHAQSALELFRSEAAAPEGSRAAEQERRPSRPELGTPARAKQEEIGATAKEKEIEAKGAPRARTWLGVEAMASGESQAAPSRSHLDLGTLAAKTWSMAPSATDASQGISVVGEDWGEDSFASLLSFDASNMTQHRRASHGSGRGSNSRASGTGSERLDNVLQHAVDAQQVEIGVLLAYTHTLEAELGKLGAELKTQRGLQEIVERPWWCGAHRTGAFCMSSRASATPSLGALQAAAGGEAPLRSQMELMGSVES